MNGARHDVLLMELPPGAYVALASGVTAVGARDPRAPALASAAVAAMTFRDLGAALGIGEVQVGAASTRQLIVRCDVGAIGLATAATMELRQVAANGFYRLPRLFRRCSCQPWVKGVVALAPSAANPEDRLAVWIDLRVLAESLLSTRRSSSVSAGADPPGGLCERPGQAR